MNPLSSVWSSHVASAAITGESGKEKLDNWPSNGIFLKEHHPNRVRPQLASDFNCLFGFCAFSSLQQENLLTSPIVAVKGQQR